MEQHPGAPPTLGDEDADPLTRRAAVHRALGDPHRLRIVDELVLCDRTPSELARLTGMASNLVAFHLDVLAAVGIVVRLPSQGDARRRYVRLELDAFPPPPGAWWTPDGGGLHAGGAAGSVASGGRISRGGGTLRHGRVARGTEVLRGGGAAPVQRGVRDVLFVCTANSARSQLAAALWARRTGAPARSAGQAPAQRVHPEAVAIAAAHGLDLSEAVPRGYDTIGPDPDLIVSV